jgi:hypothetical protein
MRPLHSHFTLDALPILDTFMKHSKRSPRLSPGSSRP